MKKYSKPLVLIENYHLSQMIAGCGTIVNSAFMEFIPEKEVWNALNDWGVFSGSSDNCSMIASTDQIEQVCHNTAVTSVEWSSTFNS